MKVKLFLSVVLSAIMLCVIPLCQASAVEIGINTISTPYNETETYSYSELQINNKIATCYSNVKNSRAVKITAEQYLQKQGFLWIWSTYDNAEWKKTVSSNALSMSNTKSGLSKGLYRLKTIVKITYSSGKTETVTLYSNQKSVN